MKTRDVLYLRSFDRSGFGYCDPRGQAHDADTLANSAPQKNPLSST